MFDREEMVKGNKVKLAKQAYTLLATGTILMLGVCLLLFWVIGRSSSYLPGEERMSGGEPKFAVEELTIERGYLTVAGWSVVLGEDIVVNNTRILLYNERENSYLLIPTEMVIRGDVTEELYNPQADINYNYDNSGWLARVSTGRLRAELGDYQIVILYQNNEDYFLIETGESLVGEY